MPSGQVIDREPVEQEAIATYLLPKRNHQNRDFRIPTFAGECPGLWARPQNHFCDTTIAWTLFDVRLPGRSQWFGWNLAVDPAREVFTNKQFWVS